MFKKIISLLLAVMMIMSLVTVMATATGAVTYENTKLYFDVSSTGWNMGSKDKVGFYVHSIEEGEELAWGGKKLNGVDEGDGIWSYDPSKNMTLNDGVQYQIIFTGAGQQTADLFFDTTCFGHVAYCNGEFVENTVDSSKKNQVALWKDLDPKDYGPVKGITSLGNLVGTCLPKGETDESLFTKWLVDEGATGYANAMKYTVEPGKKTEQQLIDDLAGALNLTKDFVAQAIADSGVTSAWKADDSTLPSGAHEHTAGEAVQENVTPASCKAEGSYDEVVYCTECGEELSRETKTIDKLAHTPGEAVQENVTPASCKAEGSYDEVVYCTECGEEISREAKTIDKLAHTPGEAVQENVTPASCKAEGSYDEVVYCSECGEEISREAKTIDKLAHTPGEAVQENVVPATCKAEGSYDEVVYCSECGEEISREAKTIDMIAHDIVFVAEVPATASVDGMMAHYECTVCGNLFNDAEGKEPVSAEDLVIKASHLRGDANGDGVVDTVDVTMIQRFLAEFAVPDTFDKIAADADLDGEVDIVDVTLIQRVILNICNWDKVPANAE